ncbi:urease accessory protein UreF [Pseudonocardia oroxyli]|uniref:Urease accessory protein n=1 Tax=Pseudonocardia oroxyli TaxID=366584 RepID=A0A1G7T2L4_PSEOR|nr:urease accessory UreF family protein [Pseudonocardia oroxyli]SDG29576.1 urease accessory protein [Pseudonocardia oroxyli]
MGLTSLVLADARFPGGGHVHSGGVEEAVARGLVQDVETLRGFLLGRLRTAGLVAAAFAAAAARLAARGTDARGTDARGTDARGTDTDAWAAQASPAGAWAAQASVAGAWAAQASRAWGALDAEFDARTPSQAQREASRAQGRGTLRAVRAAWPSPVYDELGPRPHHALLVGAVCGIAGEPPEEAARCVAYLAVSGPASAAVRLLGLDPFAVNAVLIHLEPALDAVVETAVHTAAHTAVTEDLPAPGAPVLDLLAQAHVAHRGRLRLFAS